MAVSFSTWNVEACVWGRSPKGVAPIHSTYVFYTPNHKKKQGVYNIL